MGSKDKTTRRLEEFNDVFADIINVLVFDGERVVREDELQDTDDRSEYHDGDRGLRGQERDVVKLWTRGGVKFALFGLENQSQPDARMPVRVSSYDAAAYKSLDADYCVPPKSRNAQTDIADLSETDVEQRASNRAQALPPFYPVLTLVLYFGLEHWNKAKTLHEAIRFPENLADKFKRFIPNVSINLIEVAWLEDEVIDKFQSDFRIFARFLKSLRMYGESYRKIQQPELLQKIVHFLELMRMFSAYTGNLWYENYAMNEAHKKEVTMLAVMEREIQNIENGCKDRFMKKGMKEGEKKGISNVNQVYACLFKQGRVTDVQRAVDDPEYLNQLMAEFGFNDDEEEDEVEE